MKRIIKKFWGVGLIVVLLSSLFVAAAPVSAADPLNWEMKIDAPSALFFGLAPGTDVLDFAVKGPVLYTATGTSLLQSTSGGAMSANITARLPAADIVTVDFVAIAPDDANIVVVADATPAAGLCAAISVNGGATWTSMGIVQSSTAIAVTGVRGIAISPVVTGGIRYIAIAGTAGANLAGLYYYPYGAGVGAWRNAVLGAAPDFVAGPILSGNVIAYDNVVAFEFSPNFPSDYMGVALFEDVGTAATLGALDLHIASFNVFRWDTAISTGYPAVLYNGSANAAPAITVNKADLALNTEYNGGDESTRIAFAGASITDATLVREVGGVWRCFDSAPGARILGSLATGVAINSVAYDGTNLAAGSYDTNNVFRSADPRVTAPTFLPARTLKKIGIEDAGNDLVNVKFDGATLYGAKVGAASAISKSADYGNIWNDYTVMDSRLANIHDIYMTDKGDPWYVSGNDTVAASIYRISMFSVTRVLCVPATGTLDLILRGIPSDPLVVYAADQAGTILYYTADGGTARWFLRAAVPAAITDLAVESKEVIYVGSGINVYKSSNAGFTWSPPINSRLGGGNVVNNIISLGENKVLVGGTTGGVVWSTDGAATWFAALGVFNTFGPVMVAATGLAAGDYVFAAEELNNQVFRCEVSPANFLGEFKSMNVVADAVNTPVNVGIVYRNGVLYALSNNATTPTAYINRTLAPTIPGTHVAPFWGTTYAEAGINVAITAASALRASSGAPGSIMLYAVSPFFGAPTVWYYDDTIALSGPKLLGPADKYPVQIVSPLTGAVQAVNFSWSRISLATSYNLWVALDSAFAQQVTATLTGAGVVASAAPTVSSIQPGANFQPGTTYYWKVSANLPIASAWSETRSFVVQPTAASVPSISSPEIGTTVNNVKPGFSWTPVSGTTLYKFELSEGTAFAAPIYAAEVTGAGVQLPLNVTLERGKTYFWRVKSLQPVASDWSTIANFVVAELAPAPAPPIVIKEMPAPVINIPAAPPAQQIVIPPPPADKVINPTYIWAIIIIGAVLVIAVIVLIVRTRRTV